MQARQKKKIEELDLKRDKTPRPEPASVFAYARENNRKFEARCNRQAKNCNIESPPPQSIPAPK
ncbi:MAG: hypothetical protein DLM68_18350 [Hyphomicrobiales bacterium]|nr:MAG: hypothetical protein DLM68_18350 [Hyphomicrobiales bacterium]